MNRMVLAVLIGATVTFRMPAFGFGLSYPFFEDPLRTKPEGLQKGLNLPGDREPISCHEPADLSRPLTLDQAVDIGLCNNPQIKYSWANIKVQAGALGEARAAYLPVLSGSLNRTHDRTTYPDSAVPTSDLWRTTFQGGMAWRIFDFGGRAAGHRAAAQTLAAAFGSYSAALQKVLADIVQAYFDAMIAQAALKAATESEATARATLNSARAREERGAVSQSDRLRSTTALANATLELNRDRGDYQRALAVLRQILALPAGTVITVPEDIIADAEEMNKDLNSWLKEAEKNHPAIVAARAQLEAAQEQVVVARSAGLPTLNFVSNYYRNTKPGEAVTVKEAREYTVGIGLSIPFFDGFANTYKIRGAEARAEQKKADLEDTENRIALELVRAYVSGTAALQNLDASANLLKAAQEAMAVSRRRYEKGAADITELLATQSSLFTAEYERIRCVAEWNSAQLKLLASAGQMGRATVQKVVKSQQ